MGTLHARVKDGHFVVDEPTDLPEGTTVQLALVESDDEMREEERAEVMASIDRGLADLAAGRVISAEESARRLRARE